MQCCRFGDIAVGVCTAHKRPIPVVGTISIGSANVIIDNVPGARAFDLVVFNCGHAGIIAMGSSQCSVNGLPMARMFDCVVGPAIGVIVLGSPMSAAS